MVVRKGLCRVDPLGELGPGGRIREILYLIFREGILHVWSWLISCWRIFATRSALILEMNSIKDANGVPVGQ